jgi:hypothetical protein
MRAPHRAILTAALLLEWGLTGLAQSNVEFLSLASGPLIGNRVAAVSYSPIWEVGSPPYIFRVLRGDYWTDSAGHAIPWAASKPAGSSNRHHQFTRILIGPASFSLPLPPGAVGLVGITIILLLGFIVLGCVTRRRKREAPGEI